MSFLTARSYPFSFRVLASIVFLCFLNLILSPSVLAKSFTPKTKETKTVSGTAALVSVYSSTLNSSEIRQVFSLLDQALRKTGHFQFYDQKELENILSVPSSPEIFSHELEEEIGRARMRYYDFDFESAASLLKRVIVKAHAFDLAGTLPSKLSEAYLTLGLILEAQGKAKEATGAFLNAAALDPSRELDSTRYPPSIINKFSKAKLDYPHVEEGILRLETLPPGARVVLDGKEMGTTPAVLKQLPLGVHSLLLTREGSPKHERKIMAALAVEPGKPYPLFVDLGSKGRIGSFSAFADDLTRQKDYESQVVELRRLGAQTGVDYLFTARVEKKAQDYEIFLLRVETEKGGEQARGYVKSAALDELEAKLPLMVSEMLRGGQPPQWTDRIAVLGGKMDGGTGEVKKKKSFFKSWPFFVLLGVVVVGAGVGAGVGLSGGGGGGGETSSSPPPVTVGNTPP